MMKHLKRYLPISAICLLSACGSSAPIVKPHPYEQANQQFENQAQAAYSENNFSQAANAYLSLYKRHGAVNNIEKQWQAGLNRTQILLLVNEHEEAAKQLQALTRIEQFSLTKIPPKLLQRKQLIEINLAIHQQQWQKARQEIEHLGAQNISDQLRTGLAISNAILATKTHQSDALKRITEAELLASKPLQNARLLRLKAELATDPKAALAYLQQALDIYQTEYFSPGVSECYKAIATISTEEKARWFKQRAEEHSKTKR